MFRSSNILRELVQSLAKATLLLKHAVKLLRTRESQMKNFKVR